MDRGEMFYGLRENCCQSERAKVILKNSELWRKFHELDTEMIITKNGRRMFPSLQISVTHLDPSAHYCLLLELDPAASRCRYKYSTTGGWAPAGAEEAQSPQRVYLHPDSPATGDYWMSQPVSFGRLKLTNSTSPPAGHLVLSSMHRYTPRVIVARTSDPRTIAWAPSSSVTFQEAEFVAVTAYQNERITKLKIDHNPFAKGFRENGQSKRKRKETTTIENHNKSHNKTHYDEYEEEEEQELEDESIKGMKHSKIEHSTTSPASPTSPDLSSPSPCPSTITFSSSTTSSPSSSSLPYVYIPSPLPSSYPYYHHLHPTTTNQPYYSPPSPYHGTFLALYAPPPFYYPLPDPNTQNYPDREVAEDLSPQKKEDVRKFTDFSIRAITGYT